jgi:putative SOS response-associated peptidase YedK
VERVDPATGELRSAKQPHFIRRADGKLSCFAGLMSYRRDPQTGETLRSCAIVTAKTEGTLAAIHERSPLVLPESVHAGWLDRKLTDPKQVNALAQARVRPETFAHWKVRLLVNDTRLDGPELIEPMEEGEEPGPRRARG